MKKVLLLLFCGASIGCAQLMPAMSSREDLKELKVSAPVNYDMLIRIPDCSAQDSVLEEKDVREIAPRGRSEVEISREFARRRKESTSAIGSFLLGAAKVVGQSTAFMAADILSDGAVGVQIVEGILSAGGAGVSAIEGEATGKSSSK